MKRLINQTLSLVIASSLILVSLSGCEKDDQGEPPEIPPISSFVIDFSDFMGEGQKKSTVRDTYHNRNKAVIHIAIWNTVITVHMLVPTAAFIDALYEIYNKGKDNLVEINWNRTTKAGRIKDPSYYGNSDFHCWNDLGIDIACH